MLIDLSMDALRLTGKLGYKIIALDDRMDKDVEKDHRHPSVAEAGLSVMSG